MNEENYKMCDNFLTWVDENGIDIKTAKQYHKEMNKGNQLFDIFDSE
jgi:hypothetical protein